MIPTAKLVATPNPVVVPAPLVAINPTTGVQVQALRLGTLVTFDATGSNDPDGEISKYEWDLDGTPGYETTTFAPKTTERFGAAGLFPGKVRVTDNRGATAVAAVNVRAHYAPAARIVASATAAVPGQTVTFNGATSSDADGITKYEWDLDGDGTFEKTGAQQTTTFATVGPHAVKLRVTDGLGATGTATSSVKVHRAPTALVISRPVTPTVNQAVTLDASRSSDDGSIAKYEWDLNGDNTFETTTTGPTTTTVFTTTGAKRVGLPRDGQRRRHRRHHAQPAGHRHTGHRGQQRRLASPRSCGPRRAPCGCPGRASSPSASSAPPPSRSARSASSSAAPRAPCAAALWPTGRSASRADAPRRSS